MPGSPSQNWLRIAGLLLAALLSGCGERGEYPSRPVTLICPWAKGGGTDRLSRQMAMHLEQELRQPVNVINATGGKGVTGHSRGMTAWPDGYTIAMVTVELNMLHHTMPSVKMTHEDFQPLALLNQDAAALFVRADAPWRKLADLEAAIRASPGKLKASGTAIGGAWHVAMVAWLTAAKFDPHDVKWIPERGANPSLLLLTQGGVDVVCCSLPEARSQFTSGLIRPLGVMSQNRVADFPDIPTFREQGTDATFVGWRGLALPKGTPREIVDRLAAAVDRITGGQTALPGENVAVATLPEYMRHEQFNLVQGSAPESFGKFLAATDAKLGRLLRREAFASVSKDAFPPMLFPYILFGLLGVSASVLVLGKMCQEVDEPIDPHAPVRGPDVYRFALVVLAVLAFLYFAPVAGFVLTTGAILLLLLWFFGTTWKLSLPIAAVLSAGLYHVFAHFLRVPLEQGWLGW